MTLAARFSERIHDAMRQAQGLGYRPTRIQQMLAESPAVEVAKRLVTATEIHDGLVEMKKMGRLDLTFEHIMLEPEFAPLFKQIDLEYAKMRLNQLKGI